MKLYHGLLLLAVACTDVEMEEEAKIVSNTEMSKLQKDEREVQSLCPTVSEDECMTQELYEECLVKEETCDGALVAYGDCPYIGWDCQ